MLEGEQILFAVYAVQLGFATPAQVSEAASSTGTQPSRSLAERLVAAGVLTREQQVLVQRRVARHLGDETSTLATPSPSVRAGAPAAPAPDEHRPTVDLLVPSSATSVDRPPGDGQASRPAPSLPGATAEALADESDQRIAVQQAGRYTVQKVHARGGQARILLAFDEHVGRDVAIKEFYLDAADEEGSWPSSSGASSRQLSSPGQLRFLREARVTAQLEHPNIVPVHELGRKEDGTLYYTMRFVRGQTLARKLKGCRRLRERMKLLGAFWDVAKAIAFAHSRGVIHRDLKPENIMVGEFGETVLLDWGVAKVHGKKDIRAREIARELQLLQESSPGRTAAGTAIGTPSYMSPEQARGQIDDIDERSDVWGLGAVLYELLTGRPPFKAETAMETIMQVGEAALPPVRSLCPEAPPELAAVAEKALRRDKRERYQSALELSEEV
ncbi:MAG TPA: serine/threonine-protein kinase, partial [Myxococcota bacterium]|nr:serine/threonine-protein kinase [Myxococcota bacterium]